MTRFPAAAKRTQGPLSVDLAHPQAHDLDLDGMSRHATVASRKTGKGIGPRSFMFSNGGSVLFLDCAACNVAPRFLGTMLCSRSLSASHVKMDIPTREKP